MTSATANYTTYKFRAECPSDINHIRTTLSTWLLHWKEERLVFDHDGQLHGMSDADVEFSIRSTGPKLEEIRWLVESIKDCHVAAETLELAENYTGERQFEHERQQVSRRPSPHILRAAAIATRQRLDMSRLDTERVRDTLAFIETELRFPTKDSGDGGGEPSAGWIAVVEHQPTGLTAIRRVSAPRRVRDWQAEESKCMKARLAALQG